MQQWARQKQYPQDRYDYSLYFKMKITARERVGETKEEDKCQKCQKMCSWQKMAEKVGQHLLCKRLYKPNRCIGNSEPDTQWHSHHTNRLMKYLFTHDLGYKLGSPFPTPYCKCCIDIQTLVVEHRNTFGSVHVSLTTQNWPYRPYLASSFITSTHTKLTLAHWQDDYNSTLTEGQILKTDCILYGALPIQLMDTIVTLTQIPISAITKLFQNALYHIETALYRLIWKQRCKKTIKWEKCNNIRDVA